MGKKGGWFSSVKKALSPSSGEKKGQKNSKSKKRSGKQNDPDGIPLPEEAPEVISAPPPPEPVEEAKIPEVAENEQAYSVAIATAAAEAAVAAAQAAAEVVRLTSASRFSGKSKEEIAAIRIQTAFRGYLARRALRALRGLVRLKSLIEGQSVKRQAATTLKCMQTLARLQSQVLSRRIRMSEENQALQKQLQQKHETELERLRMGEEWDVSMQSKEQIEANLQSKQEAAMRRERAMAYAYSHQTKRNSKSTNPTFMDPNNPHWGWSWLERWMAARPWETKSQTTTDKDFNDHASLKSSATRTFSVTGETNTKPSLTPTAQRASRPPSRHSPATPSRVHPLATRPKPNLLEDDTKSITSTQSHRRHSIAGSSVIDNDDSFSTSPAVPSYMAPTKSARAKNKPASPLGSAETNGAAPEKVAAAPVKKRLSYPASLAGPRRHSVPGKLESTPAANAEADEERAAASNGIISS